MTTISVVMAVYNASPYLAEAIESILRQTYPHFDFIIVDDGSFDDSREIIRKYGARDRRIRPLFLDHGGTSRSVNAGVALATGKFIGRMDADDIALPERFAAQLAWINQHKVDICGTLGQGFGTGEQFFWVPESHDAISRELLFRPCLLQSSVLMHADILRENPYNEKAVFDDYEFWTRLVVKYRMGNMPMVTIKYRQHEDQTHIIKACQFADDFRRYRFRYFYTMYPDTGLQDYLPLARISDRLPMTTVTDFQKAGQWLLALSKSHDRLLRKRMAKRWQETWERSKRLGKDGKQVYRYFREHMEENSACYSADGT